MTNLIDAAAGTSESTDKPGSLALHGNSNLPIWIILEVDRSTVELAPEVFLISECRNTTIGGSIACNMENTSYPLSNRYLLGRYSLDDPTNACRSTLVCYSNTSYTAHITGYKSISHWSSTTRSSDRIDQWVTSMHATDIISAASWLPSRPPSAPHQLLICSHPTRFG